MTPAEKNLRLVPDEPFDEAAPPAYDLDPRDHDGERPDGDQYDLADRQALRRVAGLSTELEDVTEVEYRQLRLERVVLIGVWTEGSSRDAENSLAELAALAETAGSLVLEGLIQRRDKPDAATFVGSGKAKELRDIVVATGADTVIADGELTPGQLSQLEAVVKVKVIDRTALILDIFAQHASSREGKAQVVAGPDGVHAAEAARLGRVDVPAGRRRGRLGAAAWAPAAPARPRSRPTGAGSAPRWPSCAARSREMKTSRDTKRQERRRHEVPVGGDRRLHQRRQVLAAQPAHRRRRAGRERAVRHPRPDGAPGRDARRPRPTRWPTRSASSGTCRTSWSRRSGSTLEEVAEADLILHVVDGSDADPEAQLAAVRAVLADVDAHKVPELVVINKADQADPLVLDRLRRQEKHSVVVSARTGLGLPELQLLIARELPRPSVAVDVLLPYDRGDLVSRLHDDGELLEQEHRADGTWVRALVDPGAGRRARAVRRERCADRVNRC